MFKIRMCSELDHKEIVADVCWDNHTLATINQDKGLEKLEIELFPPPNQESWVLPFDKMIEIFCEAKQELHKMQKLSDQTLQIHEISAQLFPQKLIRIKNLSKDALPAFKIAVQKWFKNPGIQGNPPKKIDGIFKAGFAPKKNESLAIAYEKVRRAIRDNKFRNK